MPPAPKLRAVRAPDSTAELALIRVDDLRRLVREELEHVLGRDRDQAAILLDRAALAKALTVSMPTIDRLRHAGMPTTWVIESPRFHLDEVIAWLRAQRPSE